MSQERVITFQQATLEQLNNLLGLKEENIMIIESYYVTNITVRGNELIFSSCDIQVFNEIKELLNALLNLAKKGIKITKRDIVYALKLVRNKELAKMDQLFSKAIAKTINGKIIYPKTLGQKEYYLALKNHDVVFGIGPAGTGKTYLAVIFAVAALKKNEVKKIILTRPAVEAGESLGFLPGDLKEKVDPYLRPLYDALHDMLGEHQTEKLIEKGIIEIAPLAYMRGRTLEDAYVILDEAQNTTDAQMKMFLTRLGFNSKMIITGDITQVDLPRGVKSGLKIAMDVIDGISGVSFIYLSALDVVRHPVVQEIIERYEDRAKK